MASKNNGVVFEDYFPTMVEKLGTQGFMKELRNGFELLMERERRVITFESLKNNSALLGLQGMTDEELMCMLREGDLDGDGALNEMEFCTLMFRLSPDLMKNSKHLLEDAILRMKKKCELCKCEAKLYCESDEANLCWECDTKVHSANFIVTKHSRFLLCHSCHSLTPWHASGPHLLPTVSFCTHCHHEQNQVVPPWSCTPPPPPASCSSNISECSDILTEEEEEEEEDVSD
ncbi:calcium-binding protein PBP1 [Senna tora]|uniref:Calcium-binding protein PBP1 n=1 Tax=Senna tora TaxID=362788 RepID=A0A834SHM0_9FABA|nr:calcium-binding protein PBP1 [Senna tora]